MGFLNSTPEGLPMAVLLITYDLNNEVRRPPITKKIKELYPAWAQLSESSYAVSTEHGPRQVYEQLSPILDSNDNLLVITLSAPWWGQHGKSEVMDWLKNSL